MRHEIVLAPAAAEALKALRAQLRATVRDALERHLRYEPAKLSRSRIKRLHGLIRPQYRLRINDLRVFYDVREETVEVLAIISKGQAQAWLADEGTPHEESGPGEGQR